MQPDQNEPFAPTEWHRLLDVLTRWQLQGELLYVQL
jgi:hypothetical protein